jgi:hypothetical protein
MNNFNIDTFLEDCKTAVTPGGRPIYETAEDLVREESISDQFVNAVYGDNNLVTAVKLPKFYHVDYALVKYGQIIGWLEIKSRTIPSTNYTTYHLAYKKWREGNLLAEQSNLPYYLAVRWTDCLGVITFPNTIAIKLVIGGRIDRNDPDDREPMAEIPIDNLSFNFYQNN